MPLICQPKKEPKKTLKCRLPASQLEQVLAYCQWANIDDLDYFINGAISLVFEKDRQWQQAQKLSTPMSD